MDAMKFQKKKARVLPPEAREHAVRISDMFPTIPLLEISELLSKTAEANPMASMEEILGMIIDKLVFQVDAQSSNSNNINSEPSQSKNNGSNTVFIVDDDDEDDNDNTDDEDVATEESLASRKVVHVRRKTKKDGERTPGSASSASSSVTTSIFSSALSVSTFPTGILSPNPNPLTIEEDMASPSPLSTSQLLHLPAMPLLPQQLSASYPPSTFASGATNSLYSPSRPPLIPASSTSSSSSSSAIYVPVYSPSSAATPSTSSALPGSANLSTFMRDMAFLSKNNADVRTLLTSFERIVQFRSNSLFSEQLLQLAELTREELQQRNLESFNHKSSESTQRIQALDKMMKKVVEHEQDVQRSLQLLAQKQIQQHDIVAKLRSRDAAREECLEMVRSICLHLNMEIETMTPRITRVERLRQLSARNSGANTAAGVAASTCTAQSDATLAGVDSQLLQNTNNYFKYCSELNLRLQASASKTNEAFKQFQAALLEEQATIQQIALIPPFSTHSPQLICNMMAETSSKVIDSSKPFMDQSNFLKELQSYYLTKQKDLEYKLQNKPQASTIAEKVELIKIQLKQAKKELAQLRHERELLQIEEASTHLIQQKETLIKAALQQTQLLEDQFVKMELESSQLAQNGFPEVDVFKTIASSQHKLLPDRITDSKLEVKRSIKDYEILETLANRIFKVRFGTQLKVLKQYPFEERTARKTFIKEITALSQLQHPCIAKVEAFFREDHYIYLQLEYYEGGNLKAWLNEKKRSLEEIRLVFHLISQTLKYIHDKGIIHCDVKLENVMMSKPKQSQIASLYNGAASNSFMKPILIDFDISRDAQARSIATLVQNSTTTITTGSSKQPFIGFTLAYAAPEVITFASTASSSSSSTSNIVSQMEQVFTPAIDMWSFGIMLYKTLFPQSEPVLLPEKEGIEAPSILDNAYLKDLLTNLLKRDASQRLTADDAIVHPFFTISLTPSTGNSSSANTGNERSHTEAKMEAFNRFLFHFKNNFRQQFNRRLRLTLHRTNLVNNVLQVFDSLGVGNSSNPLQQQQQSFDMLQPFQVRYAGEEGIDVGGLTTNMYTEFFKQVVDSKHGLFELPEGAISYLPYSPVIHSSTTRNSSQRGPILSKYVNIGKVLARCIFDQRVIPPLFPLSLFKFMMCTAEQEQQLVFGNDGSSAIDVVNFRDLEIYDPQFALSLTMMMCQNGVESWGFDFNEFDADIQQIQQDGSLYSPRRNTNSISSAITSSSPSRPVTDENKAEYIRQKMTHVLITKRFIELKAMKQGFLMNQELTTQFKLFTPNELMLLLYGQDFIDVEHLISILEFEGLETYRNSKIQQFTYETLRQLSQLELKLFLEYVTGQCSLASYGEQKKITVRRVSVGTATTPADTFLPVAHVCSFMLDMPEYSTQQVMKQKLIQALETLNSSSTFHIA